jgi:glycosyltransferase involved in cell wall biosynthesis
MTDNRKLNIGIDVTTLINHGHDIGAGRYISNLVRGILSLAKPYRYTLFGTLSDSKYLEHVYSLKEEFEKADLTLKFIKAGQRALNIYQKLRFPPIEIFGIKTDLIHCTDYMIPPTLNKNIVLSIHDLAFIRFPGFNFEWFVNKYKKLVRSNACRASIILAPSESTARDITNIFGIDRKKIKVVYLASDPVFKRTPSSSSDINVMEKFKIRTPYILSVGTIEPRKDYTTLIKSYNLARQYHPELNHMLVIAGRTGWKSEFTYSERDASPFSKDIVFTGRVKDNELVKLYNHADIFVYPSLFEGFGLPPLEAMSCGLPVICSNSSSIKEVVGTAGILVEPGDIEGFSRSMVKILKEEGLKKDLSSRSIKRSADFSWVKTAEDTLSAYISAAGRK